MKVAELTIENTETRDRTIYKNLKYDMLENMHFRLYTDSPEDGTIYKVYRDFETKNERGDRIYFAYPQQTLENLNCKTVDDVFNENFENTIDYKYRCDVAYLKKIIKDRIKYTIRIYCIKE